MGQANDRRRCGRAWRNARPIIGGGTAKHIMNARVTNDIVSVG